MKRSLQVLGWALLLSVVLSVGLIVAVVTLAGGIEATTIRIDGDSLDMSNLDAAHSLLAIGGVAVGLLVTLFVCFLVVPLAVLVPLGIVAVVLIGVAIALTGVMAVLCSPLIIAALAVWLIVRLARRNRTPKVSAAEATIAG